MNTVTHKVAYVECEGSCGFGVVFDHDVRQFWFCSTHKFGATVPPNDTRPQICRPCTTVMERYVLAEEDNLCPICRSAMLAVCYVKKSEDNSMQSMTNNIDGQLIDKARELVKTRIGGMRKGTTDDPAYLHSFRVLDMLKDSEYDDDVCLGGLLHDIVEDGNTSFSELERLGFSDQTVAFVRLCTHDHSIINKDARWTIMIAGLIEARNEEAWAIKIADTIDNIAGSVTMTPERGLFLRNVKAPLVLATSKDVMGDTKIWKKLQEQCNP